MNAPCFSIVIPNYNGADFLDTTVRSCLGQQFDDIEVIVVDDGSSDNSVEVLRRIQDPRLVVVEQNNAGPAAARNRGIDAAKGKYVAFLDADDIWYPGFLQTVHDALQETPDLFVYTPIIVDRGVGRYWIKPDRALADDESIYDYLYRSGAFIQTSTMVLPQARAAAIRWDENITFGDNDQFAIDAWESGLPFHMLPEPWVVYNDVISDTALSQLPLKAGKSSKHINFIAWMEARKSNMSHEAWIGFRAHFESVATARDDRRAAFKLILAAKKAGVLSWKGVLRQSVQTFAPLTYRKLVDRYVQWFGKDLDALRPQDADIGLGYSATQP